MESEFVDCITMEEKNNDMNCVIKVTLLNVKVKQQVESVRERIISVGGEKKTIIVNFQ